MRKDIDAITADRADADIVGPLCARVAHWGHGAGTQATGSVIALVTGTTGHRLGRRPPKAPHPVPSRRK
ncbi:hypothetical protein [Krasilnikovia sp. M28-CT-15]|uniref:hypothetical protein n=1 Tax=Krasilnikovia sp. M28-CT-15 TaxID=3373540 RepID=UPI003876A8BF